MTIGSQLRKARLARQVSLEDVYEKTKIRPSVIAALEDDNFSKMPEPIYVKSFLKEYAKYLGLDLKAILDEYSALIMPGQQEETENNTTENSHPAEGKTPRAKRHINLSNAVKPVLFGIAVIILSLALVRLPRIAKNAFRPFFTRNDKQQMPAKKVLPVKQQAKAQDSIASDEKYTVPSGVLTIPKNEKLDLWVKVNDDVWIELKRDGDIVFKSVLKKGTEKNWQAEEGFELWTGNASAMEITLNKNSLGSIGRGVKKGIVINRQGIVR